MENKKQALKEMSFLLKSIQLGKAEYTSEVLSQFQELLKIDDYFTYREHYIELITVAFCFRTPRYTHPVKTAAAKYLDGIMSELKAIEWGLILSFLREGYVSKSLAMILTKHYTLITESGGPRKLVFDFIKGIKDQNGNLDENENITPFTEAQKKRVDDLYALYQLKV